MIPIGDSVPSHRRPWVNLTIMALTIAVFIVEVGLGDRVDVFIHRWGATPLLISRALAQDPQVPTAVLWTLVTSMFLHAGWMHLLGNMLFLWVFGDNVEDRLGHLRYLGFYLVCGVGASLVQVYVNPTSPIPMVGASGAIAGVLGAYLFLWPRARVNVLLPVFVILVPLQVPAVIMLGVWFVGQLASGLATVSREAYAAGGVAWWAHIGGFVIGFLMTPFVPKRSASATIPYKARLPLVSSSGVSARPSFPVQVVNFGSNALESLILVRLVLVFFDMGANGPLSSMVQVIYAVTWVFVGPFSHYLPALRFQGFVLELFSVLALLVYHLLAAAIIWVLTVNARSR